MATRTVANGGGLWSAVGTWVEGAVPLASDDVVFTVTSGVLTIDAGAVCRSFDTTNSNGIIHLAAVTLTIGDATAGAGNVALKFTAGTTYTIYDNATSAINFISTSAVVQTVDFAGKYTGNVTFNASSNGSWQYTGTHNNILGTLTFTKGTLNFNGQTVNVGAFNSTNSNVRTLTMGSSAINLSGIGNTYWTTTTVTNLTVTANTAIVTLNRNPAANAPLVSSAAQNWNGMSLVWVGGGIMTINAGASTFKDITLNGAPPLVDVAIPYVEDRWQVNSACTFTGTLTLNGYSAGRRLRMHSNSGLRTFTNTGAVVTGQYTDFSNMSFTTPVNLSAMTGGSGDLGGNSNITFTTGATQYWYSATGGTKNWSNQGFWFLGSGGTGGAGRSPLPQDDVRFDSASFGAANTVVSTDVRAIGRSIDWTGVTNNPDWSFDTPSINLDCINFGSLILDAAMSVSAVPGFTLTMFGSGAGNFFTLNTAGISLPLELLLVNFAATNTLTFNSHVSLTTSTSVFQMTGLINANGYNLTCGRFVQSSGTLTMGSGTFEVTGTGTVWSTGGTIVANTSLVKITNNTTSTKSWSSNQTYNNVLITGNTSCTYTFAGNTTVNDFQSTKTVAYSLLFVSPAIFTVTTFTVSGSAGNLVTISSTTAANHTLTKAGGGTISTDYVIVSRSTASPAATWSAGANSIDGGNNTNWSFAATQPFVWTGAVNNNWNLAGNWFGGAIPGVSDVAIFTGAYNINCTINATGANCKGIFITNGYTGTITQADVITLGTSGFEMNGGTFTGATQAIMCAGPFIQRLGTFTNTSGTFAITSQGTTTWSVSGGTHSANNGLVRVDGTLDAVISNTTGTRFYNFEWNCSGVISGTFFVNNNLTRTVNGADWNADTSVVAGYLGAGVGGNGNGTGIIRLIGTGAVTLTYPYAPGLQINGAGATITLSNDIEVWATFTTTTVGTVNSNNFRLKGNISMAATTTAGTTNTIIDGTLNQFISGAGILVGNVTVNKNSGLVLLNANISPNIATKTFTITKGCVCTNTYDLTLSTSLTVSTGGSLSKTPTSVLTTPLLTGVTTPVNTCFKAGRMLMCV